MKKNPSPSEDLNIYLDENQFESIKTTCMQLEQIFSGNFSIKKNSVSKCNAIALKLLGCRAVRSDIVVSDNTISSVYNAAFCIDSSIALLTNNSFASCQGGVILFLTLPSPSANREDNYDSHRDIILRESMKDGKDSFIGASGSMRSHILVSSSVLCGPGASQPITNTDSLFTSSISRVIMRDNKFKEIAHYGVLVQYNGSCSIKISDCKFRNVKEPVVINEKDSAMSRNNTRNYFQQDNSELLAPTYQATPRQIIQSSGKGTIVVKNNSYEGSDGCVVRKHVSSYLYDLNNVRQSRKHLV